MAFELRINGKADGIVTVYSSQFDMGQNSYHGLATLVAEELDVALDNVRVEGRAGNPKWYGNLAMGGAFQLTGGSSSMPSSWERHRKAGAAARELLKQATANGDVMHRDAEKAGWSQPVAAGRYRGVAVHQSFGGFVATAAEVSKNADGGIQVERCVVASDCGTVINPDIVRAQIEGGTGFGLSAMPGERIALENGAPTASNYDAYRVLRIDAMPTVEVHMLPSTASPACIGECAVPPIGPAVANAIFQATGKRVRDLPFLEA